MYVLLGLLPSSGKFQVNSTFRTLEYIYWEKWWHVQYLFYPLYIYIINEHSTNTYIM